MKCFFSFIFEYFVSTSFAYFPLAGSPVIRRLTHCLIFSVAFAPFYIFCPFFFLSLSSMSLSAILILIFVHSNVLLVLKWFFFPLPHFSWSSFSFYSFCCLIMSCSIILFLLWALSCTNTIKKSFASVGKCLYCSALQSKSLDVHSLLVLVWYISFCF